LPQLTANHFLLMRLMAFPTEAVSVVPAHVSIDHALAGRGDRYEHHFLAACRTTRENRWDAVRRYAYCRHVRTSLVPVCWGCPITTGGCKKSFGSGRGFFKLKLGHCEIQSRPQGVKTGQHPKAGDVWPEDQRKLWLDTAASIFKMIYKATLLKRKRPPPEAALLSDDAAAFFTHDCVVSVNLASKSRPAASEIFQSMGFNLTLRHFHQATTFCPLISAMLCAIHKNPAPRANISKSQYLETITPQGSSPRTYTIWVLINSQTT